MRYMTGGGKEYPPIDESMAEEEKDLEEELRQGYVEEERGIP